MYGLFDVQMTFHSLSYTLLNQKYGFFAGFCEVVYWRVFADECREALRLFSKR